MTVLNPDLELCQAALETLEDPDSHDQDKTKARMDLMALCEKYRPEVVKALLQDSACVLHALGPVPEPTNEDSEHAHWGLLREWHQHFVDTHKNVQQYLKTL